jgi:hypothetical protein
VTAYQHFLSSVENFGELMNQLVALPVSGDAFLLRSSGRVILVDGGKSSVLLAGELAKYGVRHLDIVVCTHADYDHAGGLVDLLDRSAIKVREFWLPGAWAESLPTLLTAPVEVVDDLIQTLDREINTAPLDADPEEFEEQMHSYVSRRRNEYRNAEPLADRDDHNESFRSTRKQGTIEQWDADLPLDENAEKLAARAFRSGRSRIRYRVAKRKVSKPVAAFWLGLIDTAERIRRIAVQAMHHGVPVRWFDFGEFAKTRHASGGDAGFLIPLNAVELASPPPPPIGLSFLVRLTPINEECLVFLSPTIDTSWGELSILFTGDSPLGNGNNYSVSWLQWPEEASRIVIATAPHHGSESNFAAYEHLDKKVDVLFWVRSGGTDKHPGRTYRMLDPSSRICTNCPHSKKPRQAAEIHFPMRPWWFPLRTNGHICSC